MKNKKLLLFLLTAISVSAIGAVGCKNKPSDDDKDKDHEHTYTWQSNADGHWQKCDCGETTTVENHVDVKNNETDAEGKDGKCDVCDYAIKQAVTFDMKGHGTAPETQNVGYGEKATKPADPVDEEYNFLGWYKDAACTTAFDFNDGITDATVIYAKWELNTTPGESKKYAFALELNTPNAQALTSKGYSYYKYTATEDVRLEVSLGMGTDNKKCYFSTDKDEADVYYGNGYDNDKHVYDVFKGETIYIKLSCKETLSDGAKVSVLVDAVINEDLPADAWLDGIYTNGSTSIVLNRTAKSVVLNDETAAFNYLGGKINTLSFEVNSTKYKVKIAKNGTYTLSSEVGGSTSTASALTFFAKTETPVELSKFSGTYTPVDDNMNDKISEIGIDEDGSGYYFQNGFLNLVENVSYDMEYSILTYGQYLLTVNIKDGSAVSLNVFGGEHSKTVVYTKSDDYTSPKLPLAPNDEYEGATYKITDNYGYSQYLGSEYPDPMLTVVGIDKENNVYTVEARDPESDEVETYKLKFEGEGNNTVIKLYDATGETLLDTLIKYFVDYKALPSASATVTMPTADFKKDFYHFKATTAGWYSFNCTDENVAVYYNMSADYPTSTDPYFSKQMNFTNGAVAVYLTEDAIVGVYNMYYGDVPESIAIDIAPTTAPLGLDESNPCELTGLGNVGVDFLAAGNKLYVKYTPEAAGSYLIKVTHSDGYLLYTVDGTQTGFDPHGGEWGWGEWIGDLSNDNPNYKLTVSDTTPVWIIVDGDDSYSVEVIVSLDYTAGATELNFVDTVEGNVMTKTATVTASGTYYVADTFDSDLTVTSNSAFTAMLNGVDADVTNEDGVYTLIVPAGRELYVAVDSAVTFTMSFEKGTKGYPIDIALTDGEFTYSIEAETTLNFKFTQAGSFVANCADCAIYLNSVFLDRGQVITVKAGDLLTVDNYDPVARDLEVGYALPTDISKGKYSYTVSGVETLITIGASSITFGDKTYSIVGVSGNTYSLKAEDASTATLVIGDTLTLDGHELTFKPLFNENQVGTYKVTGDYGETITLILQADGSGSLSMGYMPMPFTATEDGSGYTFNLYGDDYTFTFDGDGNVELNVPYSETMTLTKAVALEGTLYSGSYETMGGDSAVMELIISDDLTSGMLSMNDPEDIGQSDNIEITLTATDDNTYTFTDSIDYWTGTITIDGDTVSITIDYSTIVGVELTKQS